MFGRSFYNWRGYQVHSPEVTAAYTPDKQTVMTAMLQRKAQAIQHSAKKVLSLIGRLTLGPGIRTHAKFHCCTHTRQTDHRESHTSAQARAEPHSAEEVQSSASRLTIGLNNKCTRRMSLPHPDHTNTPS